MNERMETERFAVRWRNRALYFLLFAALAGTILRYHQLRPFTLINYKYLLHAHSHVAMLGWLFLAYAVVIVRRFFSEHIRVYNRLLGWVLVAVVGMAVSFPWQGYGAVSITFSTLFLLVSYRFAWQVYRHLRRNNDNSLSAGWLRWALAMLVLSSAGPWALGPIIALGGSHGVAYNLAIFFYLHFLYNGFFVPATFALVQRQVEKVGEDYDQYKARLFYRLTVWAIVPAYALSTLWAQPPWWVYVLAGLAALAQAAGLYYGRQLLRLYAQSSTSRLIMLMTGLVWLAYLLKVVLQIPAAWPAVADFVYQTRVFTAIGYIHLVMLGVLTLFALVALAEESRLQPDGFFKTGFGLFLTGFVVTELLFFVQGMLAGLYNWFMPAYRLWVLGGSWAMFLGLSLIAIAFFKKRKISVSEI